MIWRLVGIDLVGVVANIRELVFPAASLSGFPDFPGKTIDLRSAQVR
ncbi:hypothetical protein [Rhodopseudomonas palustris]|nr:hypothetical protein [Rhodopseudomonas palustris]